MDSNSLIKSSNGITSVSLDARLLSSRVIYIDDQEITGELIANIVKKIMVLASEDSEKTITIMIDSPGGSVKAGMVLYDLLQTCKTPIRMVAAGRAYSMAAVLLAAGRHGRYILPNSEVMIHQPLLGSPVTGNCSSIKSVSDKMNKEKKKMNRLLAKHTGKTEKQIEKATGYDHFFDADEAVAFGLCDGIIGFDEIMEG
jgi:ATP-dependent Clp protease protease subunit